MQAHLSYQIKHIYLNRQQTLPELDNNQKGNYLVFWWKEIALGHIFVDPGNKFTEATYCIKLIEAISPAIQLYTKETPEITQDWQQFLLNHQFDRWLSWMESVFSPRTPAMFPVTVPVSVVICTRNRASSLKRCLAQFNQLACLPEEIIVIDNAPTDDSTQEVVRQFDRVVYIKEPRPGLDIARNTGVLHANTPVVAFTDDDVLVHPLWVYRVWETFQEKTVAAMTGLVIAAQLDTEAQLIFEKHWSFNRGFTDKIYDTAYFNQTLAKGPPVWEIGAGANMAFRKEVFQKVGLFDELLDVGAAGCNGDSEMWYRILEGGYTIHYNPRAIVHHEHRREIEGLKKQLFYYMRGFTAAALLQQRLRKEAGYKRHLMLSLPIYYARLLRYGFPFYKFRYRTLGVEIKGIFSGLLFYRSKRHIISSNIRK